MGSSSSKPVQAQRKVQKPKEQPKRIPRDVTFTVCCWGDVNKTLSVFVEELTSENIINAIYEKFGIDKKLYKLSNESPQGKLKNNITYVKVTYITGIRIRKGGSDFLMSDIDNNKSLARLIYDHGIYKGRPDYKLITFVEKNDSKKIKMYDLRMSVVANGLGNWETENYHLKLIENSKL